MFKLQFFGVERAKNPVLVRLHLQAIGSTKRKLKQIKRISFKNSGKIHNVISSQSLIFRKPSSQWKVLPLENPQAENSIPYLKDMHTIFKTFPKGIWDVKLPPKAKLFGLSSMLNKIGKLALHF
jgi:hypothetical protein